MSVRFLLDINVLSELMRAALDPEVLDWFDHNRNAPMMTSAIYPGSPAVNFVA